jgi:hypothetical protein
VSAAVVDVHPSGPNVVYIAGHAAGARLQQPIASVIDLVDLGARLHRSDGVTHLWLTPRLTAAHPIEGLERAWTPVHWAGDWPAAIVAPSLNRRLRPALESITGAALLETVELLAGTLRVGVHASPAGIAESLLRGVLEKRGEFQIPLCEPVGPAVTEPEANWIRPLDPDEQDRPWVLAIDRRGAYLLSMLLCDVGLGGPEHLERPNWPALVWTPGVYHARIGPWREVYLPDPVRLGRSGALHWLTAPTLRLAAALGMVEEVLEAWVWPRKSRVLRPIAQRIVTARRTFAERAPSLVQWGDPLLKRAYTELVGRLRWEHHKGTPLYRPDWHAHIVADSRCRVIRDGLGSSENAGVAPAALAVDCWYVLADQPELPAGFDPKFWRLDAAIPTEKLRECFDLAEPSYSRGPVGALAARVARSKVHA